LQIYQKTQFFGDSLKMYRLSLSSIFVAWSGIIVAGSIVALPQSAQAFLITRDANFTPGPFLAVPPTVADFNVANNPVSTTPTLIASSTSNGDAFIQRLSGVVEYQGNQVNIGTSGNNSPGGVVSFTFNGANGQGYLGLNWQNLEGNEVIRFYSDIAGSNLIQQLTYNQIVAQAFGSGSYFNFIVTNNSEVFRRVELEQLVGGENGNFFRVDSLAYQQIPTPALLPGLLGLGASLWNKRRKQEFIEN
jgi:hypothetical protein